eukprot:14699272-Alexandrium_andersonii.AAC.1
MIPAMRGSRHLGRLGKLASGAWRRRERLIETAPVARSKCAALHGGWEVSGVGVEGDMERGRLATRALEGGGRWRAGVGREVDWQ